MFPIFLIDLHVVVHTSVVWFDLFSSSCLTVRLLLICVLSPLFTYASAFETVVMKGSER